MSGNDILTRVRRAVHMADSLHTADNALAEEFLRAAERCRESNRDLLHIVEQLKTHTAAAETARLELQQQLTIMDCGEKLLLTMVESGNASQAEIHTKTPPNQLQ